MKELDQFTFEQLAKWVDAGKEAHDRHDGIRMAGVHVASLAKIALSAKVESEPHKRREIHAGGNLWIQCSKQAYDRAEAAGERVRILYERPALNYPETPDGWVACSERMPTDCQAVLCSNLLTELSGIPFIADYVGMFELYDGTKYESGFYVNRELQAVTHWMPLPAAPKQEK